MASNTYNFKTMTKKIVSIFLLVIFLSLAFSPVVSADTCYCQCSDGRCITTPFEYFPYTGDNLDDVICMDENHCGYIGSYICLETLEECQGSASGDTSSPSNRLTDPLGLSGDIGNLWVRLIGALLGFVAIASLVTFVYAGFMFLISTGNAEKVKKAKDIIIYAVLGIFISIASYTILSFIFKTLEG